MSGDRRAWAACVVVIAATGLSANRARAAASGEPGGAGNGRPEAAPGTFAASPAQACGAFGWVKIEGVPGGITSIAGSPDYEFQFAGTFASEGTDHLFRGTALDATWQGVPGLAAIRVTAIAVGPGSNPSVWVSEWGGGAYASDTGGSSFRATGLANASVTALTPITSTVLAAASAPTRSGIYGWDPGTNTWALRGGDTIASPILFPLVADSNDYLWLGTEAAGLWRSDDAARTWSPVSVAGNTSSTVIAIAPDPAAPSRIYVGHGRQRTNPPSASDIQGAHVTQNGGVSWAPVLTAIRDVTGIAPLTTLPGQAYAAGWGRGLLHTTDGGVTWRAVPGPLDPVAGDASQHLEALVAIVPRGTTGCELLMAGGAGGLWARNVAGATYHSIYLPMTRCQSAHCQAASAHTDTTLGAPLRVDVVPR